MNQPTQGAMFVTPCGLSTCKLEAGRGGILCDTHWTQVPEDLKYRLAFTRQEMNRAQSQQAKDDARRKFDVARQACVQAVAR